MVPLGDGEREGLVCYEVRWELAEVYGAGESREVPTMHLLKRPEGITTMELEEWCWEDYDRRQENA